MKSTISSAIGVVVACSVSVAAQWPKYQASDVPRDAQGRVAMDAPPPRTPDGKPNLSGNWMRADRDPLPSELAGIVGPRDGAAGRGASPAVIPVEPPTQPFPPDPRSPPLATFFELGANIPGGLRYTQWAEEVGIVRDEAGYLVTGPDLMKNGSRPKNWTLDRDPYYMETNMPGVFAAGDVRHGSVKRCASAVGEGAMAVTFVHRYVTSG
jgi:hypothetical protein